MEPKKFRNILKLNNNEIINYDTLTIPPIIPLNNQEVSPEFFFLPTGEYPLLNSRIVRKHVQKVLLEPTRTRLQLHKLEIEIFYFFKNQFHVFIHSSLEHILQSASSFNGVRRLFSAAFPIFSSLILHSSSIIVNNRAILFLAPDEGGKTTAVGLGDKQRILCDDYNVLCMQRDRAEVHSTPWGSICNGPKSALLGGFFFLEKARKFSLKLISPNNAIQIIWKENDRFLKNVLPEFRKKLFLNLCRVCNEIPAYNMTFSKEFIDWNAISNAIKKR